ncbi:disease resistance protein RPM1-like [Cornus florida]|uniref:disease resistance protein RPM1-like n=1 Tax=Cornus florida TaxID=4283 RepID=UPI0028A07EC7|nr:disease resistance protein RPM1-like [Cornus florida]
MTMEEVAEGYLNELINRSLVQSIYLGELAAYKSFSSTPFITHVWVEKPISKSLNPILFIGGVTLLKVLDLRGASLEILLDEVGKLFHLRYLSLRKTRVITLPKSIGKLENLETLDLKNIYVTELPVQTLKLQRLRHLLVYRDFKAIVGIEGLSSLQKLCYIEANRENGRIVMGELGRLTQLRRLGIRELRREDGKDLCSSFEKLSNLQSLNVFSVKEEQIVDFLTLVLSSWVSSTALFVGTFRKFAALDNFSS